MLSIHRAHLQWTPQKLIDWGLRIGVSTAQVVTWQLEHRPHPEQGYRACLGLQRLAREFTPARLEAACTRAVAIQSLTYRTAWPPSSKTAWIASKSCQQLHLARYPCTTTFVDQSISTECIGVADPRHS